MSTYLLPDRIKDAREVLGWTREILAAYSGVSVSTIGRIERDEMQPRPGTMIALAVALGFPSGHGSIPRPEELRVNTALPTADLITEVNQLLRGYRAEFERRVQVMHEAGVPASTLERVMAANAARAMLAASHALNLVHIPD